MNNRSLRKKSRVIMKEDTVVKLEKMDKSILQELSKNVRKPIIDIARKLHTTPRVVQYCIKQLIKEKVILGFKIAINYEKLGIRFYKTFMYLDNLKQERVHSLIQYCEQHKNIIHHVKVLGSWDLEPEFEAYSEEEFNAIITDIKDKFSDIIKRVDVITITKEHKFVYF